MEYTPLEQNTAALAAILCIHKDSSGLPWIGDNGSWWIGEIDTGIEATPGNKPVIGDDGCWVIGGVNTGIPVDPTLPDDMDVPYIGDNGSWWIGNNDTGIEAKPGDKPVLNDDDTISINGTGTGVNPLPSEDYAAGYSAGYAQAQKDGVPNGAHPSESTVSIPVYRPLYINVTTDSASGVTVYEIEEKGQRWDLLPDSVSGSYRTGYKAGYKHGYKYAAQLDGYYLEALEYIWDEPTAMLTVDEVKGLVSELPENTYTEED